MQDSRNHRVASLSLSVCSALGHSLYVQEHCKSAAIVHVLISLVASYFDVVVDQPPPYPGTHAHAQQEADLPAPPQADSPQTLPQHTHPQPQGADLSTQPSQAQEVGSLRTQPQGTLQEVCFKQKVSQ